LPPACKRQPVVLLEAPRDDEPVDTQVTSPVLVGRRDELRVLDGVLDRAAAGEFAMAAIGGEAGIGKTRLSMLVGELARRQGFKVLIGGCLDIGESTEPYALIATYRSEELPLHYPVRKLVADLHRYPGCQHLQLPPLTEPELRELAEAILGHPAVPDLVRELAARAQGNPF
jgi:predicted ATPase